MRAGGAGWRLGEKYTFIELLRSGLSKDTDWDRAGLRSPYKGQRLGQRPPRLFPCTKIDIFKEIIIAR